MNLRNPVRFQWILIRIRVRSFAGLPFYVVNKYYFQIKASSIEPLNGMLLQLVQHIQASAEEIRKKRNDNDELKPPYLKLFIFEFPHKS